MKNSMISVLVLLLALTLTACGGERVAARGTAGGAPTVAQLMDEAEKSNASENGADAPAEETAPDAAEPDAQPLPDTEGVDVDLTQMNATMVFAEVSNIMYDPDVYVGKTIRMAGLTASDTDQETESVYHAVIIRDATACCASGLEYLLAEGQDYPKDGVVATVTGEFELYEENGVCYGRLKDARLGA